MTNNSLKDYYIQLHKLSSNNTKIMNAISESFKSYNPEVVINLDDSDEQLHIPSFIYLENKLEELETSINYLFNLPQNGEAWFTKDSDMYKLNLVHSNILPTTPSIALNDLNFNVTNNNFLKDLIFPKTTLRINVSHIPSNITEVYVKKIILHNQGLIDDIYNDNNLVTYNDFKEKIYLMNKNVDYEEYDTKMSLPFKDINYSSQFNILYYEYIENTDDLSEVKYKIRVNTLYYYNVHDYSIEYKLKVGDYISLSKHYNIFKITNINEYVNYDNGDNSEYIIEVLETNGHTTLDTYENNNDMYFVIYTDESKLSYNYIDIPLDNHIYTIIFISSVYNNVKSLWSNAIKLNLNTIYITDDNGKTLSYSTYFDKYCTNLGSILTSFANNLYIQPNSFTNEQLQELTNGKTIQNLVTQTLYKENNEILSITVLNDHLVDDEISSNLSRLHKQKIEISNTLNNINTNIDETYNQLINTDFSQDTSVTQTYLKSKLDSYYTERLTNQQQLISVINNIDLIKNDIVGYDELKYRVRGITNANETDEFGIESEIVTYLHDNYGIKCDLIGLEVEYKYQNVHSNSTTIENNADTVFTDWVRINNIDKQRYLNFDSLTGEYTIDYVNYNNNLNVIKWNQIDIPIQAGEDVVLRIRYKYNIGQPFINLYTPWSDNITVSYSDENSSSITDITQILQTNEADLNNSKFISELISGGYQDHITNKIIDNSQVYYHLPENIYSGFNTAENKFISLKDKLIDIDKNINEYKEYISNELSSEYKVFLQDDKQQLIELTKNNINTINFQIDGDNYDSFIRKDLNLVIKNTGNVPINFYSLFPGNTDIPLIHSDINHFTYKRNISDYERVPLLLENIADVQKSIFPQVLGQWIYFRSNNVYTKENLYYINQLQNNLDVISLSKTNSTNCEINYKLCNNLSTTGTNKKNFIGTNNQQMLLGYRNRDLDGQFVQWQVLSIDNIEEENNILVQYLNNTNTVNININDFYNEDNVSKFVYSNSLLKYEHIQFITKDDNENDIIQYIDPNTSLTYEFGKDTGNINKIINNFQESTRNTNTQKYYNFNSISDLYGMFLIPNLLNKSQIICDNDKNNQYKKLNVGESISIPLLCEYFMDNNENFDIYKTIAFSLQTSLTKDIDNYILKVIVSNKLKYNATQQEEIYIPLISSDIFD